MALIIGEKNPKRVESGDIWNLVRASYGKPEVGTAIGEQNDAKNAEEEAAKQAAEAMKAEQEKDAEEKAAAERKAKLEEISKLPEEEQVAALLEAGFEEESVALSAKFAEKQEGKENNTDDVPTPKENESKEEETQDNIDGKGAEKPKRGGRPKKS